MKNSQIQEYTIDETIIKICISNGNSINSIVED